MENPNDTTGHLDRLLASLSEWLLDFFSDDSQGLSLKEGMLLQVIGARKFIKMSDLASLLHLPLTTATSMVDRLAAKKLLKRSRFEDERRIVAISLTPEGQALWESRRRDQSAWLEGLLGRLSEEEQGHLLALVEKMGSGVTKNTPS